MSIFRGRQLSTIDYSASLGLVEELREQIRLGVDVTAIVEENGSSALHVAADFGQENVVNSAPNSVIP